MKDETPRLIQPVRCRSAATFWARIPGSKSQTLRALTIAAMSEGASTIRGALRAADTDRLAAALGSFQGLRVTTNPDAIEVRRDPGRLRAPADWIDIGAGAAPARFLIAFAAGAEGACRVTGTQRLRDRPMAALISALQTMGIQCDSTENEGRLPIIVRGAPFASRRVEVDADVSSQFASALMLALSASDEPAEIRLHGEAVSRPYLAMTVRMLAEARVRWQEPTPATWRREAGRLQAHSFQIEPDASSAGYFFALAAATGTNAAVSGFAADSLQADLALLDALAEMGCEVLRTPARTEVRGAPLRGIDINLRDAPDTAPTIAALATLATGPTTITGIAHLRIKESDRIAAICSEASRLGARATSGNDWLRIEPTGDLSPVVVQCHDDHRIAMAFSVVGAARPGVSIAEPWCVAKSFDGYWSEFDRFLQHHEGSGGGPTPRDA